MIVGPETVTDGQNSVINYLHNTTYPLYDINDGLGSGKGIGYLTPVASQPSAYFSPFYTGQSSTANTNAWNAKFLATSTAGYGAPSGPTNAISGATPPLAGVIGPLYASYSSGTPNLGGWSLLKEVQINGAYSGSAQLGVDDYIRCECVVQIYATGPAILQYAGSYAQSQGALNNHYITQDKVSTMYINNEGVYTIPYSFTYRGGYPNGAVAVRSMALWMRACDYGPSGSRILFTNTSMILTTPYIYDDYIQGFPFQPSA